MSKDFVSSLEQVLPADLLRIPQAAVLLGVHPITGWKYISPNRRGGVLRSMKVGGKRFTRREWVEKFIRDSAAASDV